MMKCLPLSLAIGFVLSATTSGADPLESGNHEMIFQLARTAYEAKEHQASLAFAAALVRDKQTPVRIAEDAKFLEAECYRL